MSFQSFKQAFSVTPSDTSPLPTGQCKALYVGGPAGVCGTIGITLGGGGDLTVKFKEPNFDYAPGVYNAHVGLTAGIVTFSNVPRGAIIPVAVTHVMSTNTTATNIVSLH